MANTTNFGWETPDDTDLVKDGAAAIRTLGSAIDTSLVDFKGGTTGQVLAKASNTDMDFTWATDASGIPATIFDAKGDIIAASAADTAARLAVGANNTVLTADSSTATGLKWATPSAGANWTLLNAGGTALTGADTVTISGISGQNQLMIILETASSANTQAIIGVRINADTNSNYYTYGLRVIGNQTYDSSISTNLYVNTSYYRMGRLGLSADQALNGYCLITGCNSSGVKIINAAAGISTGGSYNQEGTVAGGYYNGSSTVSSVSIFSSSGNLDNGTVYVYATA